MDRYVLLNGKENNCKIPNCILQCSAQQIPSWYDQLLEKDCQSFAVKMQDSTVSSA